MYLFRNPVEKGEFQEGMKMKIPKKSISAEIRTNLDNLEPYLSIRVQNVLETLLNEEFPTMREEKIDLFDLLVRVILLADREPASLIANLMVPLDTEGANQLDEWTISNAGAYLRDYLKKDYMLSILNSQLEESKKQKLIHP